MAHGTGFGKIILFGEHFVVYGLPAIASALGNYTTATVERIDKPSYVLVDNRKETPGYKVQKKEEYARLVKRVMGFMGIKGGLKITLEGTLVAASGVGASAACAASLARAINEEFQMGWDDEKINEAAFEGEKAGSGNPSGIDNTAAVFGGLIVFEKNMHGGKDKIETMHVPQQVEIVIGNSGKTALTREVVAEVRQLHDQNLNEFHRIFEDYAKLCEKAKIALQKSDWKTLGDLMNQNHQLLQQITVSCTELDDMCVTCLEEGAFGAKLTGTGRGGLMLALTPGEDLQENVSQALKAQGFSTIKTRIG